MFHDSTGRRWRRIRTAFIVLGVIVASGVGIAVPHVADTPALTAFNEKLGPELTSQQVGRNVPLVGTGPLVRVLKVQRSGSVVTGIEPFTGQTEAQFPPEQIRRIGTSEYVIQRFGYPDSVRRSIALTFDDGPDPKWTPELLNLLSEEKVPATFFATGTMIARHPEIFQREVREGHAVANHSLTHTDMTATSTWRARMELTTTDHIIRAVTGTEVGYFRLPYEGNDEKSTGETIDGILRSQRYGYTVTSHDFDTDDWAYASGQMKGEIPLPELNGDNVTMLLHDGGGNGRQMTLDYVRKLVPYARSQGYTFNTMPQVQPALQERVTTVTPTFWDKAVLTVVQMRTVWPETLMRLMFISGLASVLLVGALYSVLAVRRSRKRRRTLAMVELATKAQSFVHPDAQRSYQRVSVLVAAFNEEAVIARTLNSILASRYPLLEVIVVSDGSTDNTEDEVASVSIRDSRVILIKQENTGKSEALNNGLRRASGDIIVTLDADTLITPETIEQLVRHFDQPNNSKLGAVAGTLRVANRERNLLTRWQSLEYVTQIGLERAAQDAMGAISIVPGACAAWRKRAILDAGGFSHSTLAEDCDLALSLHKAGWRLTQDDEACAYTEVPDTVDALLAQRSRWVFGTFQALWKHRHMMFRRRYGLLGWFVLPNYVLSIVIPFLFLPFVVFLGFQTAQNGGLTVLLGYFAVFLACHMVFAVVGIGLMKESWKRYLLIVPVYRIVYEPLRAYLLYTSIYKALKGIRSSWNKLDRTGELDQELAGLDQELVELAQRPALALTGATSK